MHNLASIDVGSNTIRLLIGNITNQKIIRLKNELAITRLAENISETEMLKKERMLKSLSALKRFSHLISDFGVDSVKAVGTSALREAKNSDEFIDMVLSETGIKIKIVSGLEEAQLTAKGVLHDMLKSNSSLIMDIGGGSTEWILCKDSTTVMAKTTPIGVVKLFEKHIKSDPPSNKDIAELEKALEKAVLPIKAETEKFINKKTSFIGTAGTITTFASIDLELSEYDHEKVQNHIISIQRLTDMSKKLISLPLSKRKTIKGLEPERADLIIPGIVFTIKAMQVFGFENIIVSDDGLLEGILLSLAEERLS